MAATCFPRARLGCDPVGLFCYGPGNQEQSSNVWDRKQVRLEMPKDVEPVWDQTVIDRLWVTTQREAMIESGPPPAEKPAASSAPAGQQGVPPPTQKAKEPAKQ